MSTFLGKRLFTIFIGIASILSSCQNLDYKEAEAATYTTKTYKNGFTYSHTLFDIIDEGDSYYVNATITNNKTSDVSCSIKAHLYSVLVEEGNSPYKTITVKPKFTFAQGSSLDISFRVYESEFFAYEGIKIRVEILDSSKKVISYAESCLYSKLKERLNPDVKYHSFTRLYYFDGTKKPEMVRFYNYQHLVTLENYYRIDLSMFRFEYSSLKILPEGNLFLKFIDTYNLYPNINSDESGYKVIPLTYSRLGTDYTPKVSTLYINVNTVDTSSSALSGYVMTNYLYFPRNKKKEIEEYTFYMCGYHFGLNDLYFEYDFKLDTSRLLLGPCNISDYCIKGVLG